MASDSCSDHTTSPPSMTADNDSIRSAESMRRKTSSSPSSMKKAAMKRSVSTPNVRALGASNSSMISSVEKRRNKLGYHRSAVACVHCRRRKIRCLAGPGGPGGPCQCCIRLKKDCKFYPVDQQPPIGKQLPSNSRLEHTLNLNGLANGVSSLSSSINGPYIEQVDQFGNSTAHPLSMGQDDHHFGGGPLLTSCDRGSIYETSRDFGSNSWHAGSFVDQSGQSFGSASSFENSTPFWPTSEHQIPVTYPTYTMTPLSAALPHSPPESVQNFPASSRADFMWRSQQAAPSRTTSLINSADLPYQYPSHFFNEHYPNLRRSVASSTDLQHANFGANTHPTPPGSDTSQLTPTTLSFGEQNLPAQMNMSRQSFSAPVWNPVPSKPVPILASSAIDPATTGWYNHPSGMTNVKEDDYHSRLQRM